MCCADILAWLLGAACTAGIVWLCLLGLESSGTPSTSTGGHWVLVEELLRAIVGPYRAVARKSRGAAALSLRSDLLCTGPGAGLNPA